MPAVSNVTALFAHAEQGGVTTPLQFRENSRERGRRSPYNGFLEILTPPGEVGNCKSN